MSVARPVTRTAVYGVKERTSTERVRGVSEEEEISNIKGADDADDERR